MEEEQSTYENEIDLMEIVGLFLRKWYVIAISVISVMLLVGIYAYGVMDDVYTAETRMLVQVKEDETSDSFNYQLGERLVNTYTEIAQSNNVLERLQTRVEEDQDKEYSTGALRNMIEIDGVQQTVVIKLRVESNSSSEAAYIANTLVEIIQETSSEFDGLDNIEILDNASAPNNPSGPNRTLYMAVGVVLGGMIGAFIVLGFEYLNRTIKTTKDMENKLGLSVLGEIPEYALEEEVVE